MIRIVIEVQMWVFLFVLIFGLALIAMLEWRDYQARCRVAEDEDEDEEGGEECVTGV